MKKDNWDYIIIGTGFGGASFGYQMAKNGAKVLFLEKGKFLQHSPAIYREKYAEDCLALNDKVPAEFVYANCGRNKDKIFDSKTKSHFMPFVGCGTGGSSSIYGMVLERFMPHDFKPAANFKVQEIKGSELPEKWPVSYEEMLPYYENAESLFQLNFDSDHLGLCPSNKEVTQYMSERHCHPYKLSLACDVNRTVEDSQGYLGVKDNKLNAENVFLTPALECGASILAECEVTKINSDRQKVTSVVVKKGGQEVEFKAKHYVLSAGALFSPLLLLRSANSYHKNGLGNSSGYVGKCLMRHYIDLYGIKTKAADNGEFKKQVGVNDYYISEHGKGGNLQSFGNFAPMSAILKEMESTPIFSRNNFGRFAFRVVKPFLTLAISQTLKSRNFMAFILEDLPYLENGVELKGSGLAMNYKISSAEKARIAKFRKVMKDLFSGLNVKILKQAENNHRIAHACGTCRFGDDPQKSVLNRWNQVHDVDNLSVLDTSFFPSSAGTNPSLTVIANSLRVADYHLQQSLMRDSVYKGESVCV